MSFGTAFYNTIVKRNSVYVASILTGGFVFGVGFDIGIETFWDRWNRGKQWKDIRAKYTVQEE
ncbi:hypothetical protein M422DRAFT_23036 [Sphaerobolus stellatus SS14]|nr:hypothetical protein M422DRAFT_23036 [Sphaerobolus stellatus SS14]